MLQDSIKIDFFHSLNARHQQRGVAGPLDAIISLYIYVGIPNPNNNSVMKALIKTGK
jgi:hypothetical protein